MSKQAIEDNYILTRDPSSSCRLNAQHYLWFDGNPIFPALIPTQIQDLRVAEIGVGTGIWLIHASRELPASANLDGFDISFAAAPPQEWLPSNVRLHIKDMVEPLRDDDELIGQYDIVHIKHFMTIVKDNDPLPILRNLLKLLKPGGYLIWDEWDFSLWHDVNTASAVEPDDTILRLFEYAATLGGTRSTYHGDWPSRLALTFSLEGLINVSVDNRLFPPELVVPAVDAMLTASEELAQVALDKLGDGRAEELRELIARVVRRRREVGFNFGRLTTIGQKPARVP